jgi:hypothetical protein
MAASAPTVRLNPVSLQRVGVCFHRDGPRLGIRCRRCGRVWHPDLRCGIGPLPRPFWHCPNGCNRPKES